MSKLYTAISRLDELAIRDETDPAADIPFNRARQKSGSSVRRMVVLSGALMLSGLVAVGITAWWQDWFELPQTTTSVAAPALEQPVGTAPASVQSGTALQAAATAPTEAVLAQPAAGSLLPGQRPDVDMQPLAPADPADSAAATVINRLPAKAMKNVVSATDQASPLVEGITQPRPLQLAEQLDAPSTTTGQFIDQTAQLSRWLHQAEQRRRGEDWEGAIALFTKVWQITGNPAVANNLAASLMQLGRWSEAEKILAKALQRAPGDQDLQQNLRVAQQLAKK